MIKDGFSVFLKKSEIFRNGYLKNLKYPDKNFKEKLMHCYGIVPDFMNEIYSFCNGTDVDIIDQRYFDFIPGYRLMKIEEIVLMYEEFHQLDGVVIPFLKDYSSNYIAYQKVDNLEYIISISEEGIDILHNSVYKFWETINTFYDENVYYLDQDGYLAYDFKLEGIIGKRLNAGIEYWE